MMDIYERIIGCEFAKLIYAGGFAQRINSGFCELQHRFLRVNIMLTYCYCKD